MAPKSFKSKSFEKTNLSQREAAKSADDYSICTYEEPTGWLKLYPLLVLAIISMVAFASRLYAVIRYEAIIHEFDPWFNYRASHYMVEHGFYNFHNWFDERAWYPLGRIVGGTVYPGLMLTSSLIHYVLYLLNMPVFIRDICVFLAPLFSSFTAIATFLFTKELWNTGAGLFAAAFIGIAPGYISRSVAGSYDNEGIAIFALVFTYYLWLKAVGSGSIMWATLCALSYFYMVSAWGGYVFIINLIPLHVFTLLIMGRYSERIYIAYNTFFVIGLICSMQIPFVGFQPVRTSEHMAAIGVFAVLNAYAFLQYVKSLNVKLELWLIWMACAGCVFLGVVGLTVMGVIAPWSGRFYSLYDTGYAKIHIPIIASVSEHQPTTWTSYIFDLHFLIVAFPAGARFCLSELNDKRVLIVLYAVTAVYFSGVMVRLVLTLTPVVCVLAGIAVSEVWSKYSFAVQDKPLEREDEKPQMFDELGSTPRTIPPKRLDQESESGIGATVRNLVNFLMTLLLFLFVLHCTWITSNAYSSPSIVLSTYGQNGQREILDDFREAYYWLRMNTDDDARVMSWWDYGYQIAGMGNRTTLVDNNTWNNSHIAMVGKAMSSNETAAYEIMRSLDVDYVLVIFGGLIGYSGDDINKFLWMVRIAEGEHPKDIRESDYFSAEGAYRVDSTAPPTMLNCLMYRLSYYRFAEATQSYRGGPSGFDRTRNTEIGKKNIKLRHLEEAFTSEHWLVRIYRVKNERNRLPVPLKSLRAKKPVKPKLSGKHNMA